jgi:tetratricopeptide (TPR) repeat protein
MSLLFRCPRLAALALMAAITATVASPAFAGSDEQFLRGTFPQKWIDPLMPEDLPALTYPAYFNDLDKARLESSTGRYKLSLSTLRRLKDPKPERLAEIAAIKSTSQGALGRWDDALLATLDPQVMDDPAVMVRRAEVLVQTGKAKEGIDLLKSLVEKHPDNQTARYTLGWATERVGDLDTAKKAYGWFVEKPQEYLEKWQASKKDAAFETAASVTTIAKAIDRWAALTGAYANNPQLDRTVLNAFVAAYDRIDRGYWPAHLATAEYFASHDRQEEALEELKTGALKANPNSAEALKLLGQLMIAQFNFDGADAAIASIRKVDPTSVDADLLETRNLLRQRQPKDAQTVVARVLKRQPDHLEALGLDAACYALQLLENETNDVLKKVEAIDPDNATAYWEVAEQLGAMRQYPRAAEKYKVAIARAPFWTDALNGLGLLYTQSGDEDEARQVLERARLVDPFNHATTNYLKLLDMMASMATKESEHFVVMYDAKQDPVIPEYFGEYLESVHAEICSDFKHDPSKVMRGTDANGKPIYHKTVIEVFPTHDAFSVRTTGSPWIGTVGASTGRIIALVAPRKGENTLGTYNWASVLRHEYTHTVTLSATDNRIQHWMTEGLAVWEEKTPLRWDWVPMLYKAVKTKGLFKIENLTWGFVRPKKPTDRTLAYAESYWVCQYIDETCGHDKLLQMLEEFRNAGRQEDVFPKITGKSIPDFEKDFFAWCEKQVSTWGYDEESSKKYEELKTKGEAMTKAKQYDEAIAAWEEIRKIRPVDAKPHQVLAGLYLLKKDNEKAVEHLEALSKVELKDNRFAKRITRIYRDDKKLDKAARYALDAVYTDPYDLSAHELLAEIYELSGNKEGLEREKRVMPVLTKWIEEQKARTAGTGVSLK